MSSFVLFVGVIRNFFAKLRLAESDSAPGVRFFILLIIILICCLALSEEVSIIYNCSVFFTVAPKDTISLFAETLRPAQRINFDFVKIDLLTNSSSCARVLHSLKCGDGIGDIIFLLLISNNVLSFH